MIYKVLSLYIKIILYPYPLLKSGEAFKPTAGQTETLSGKVYTGMALILSVLDRE